MKQFNFTFRVRKFNGTFQHLPDLVSAIFSIKVAVDVVGG